MGNTLQKCIGKDKASNSSVPQAIQEQNIFNCIICDDNLPFEKKFKNKDLCSHPFCNKCIIKYIKGRVEEDNVTLIKCPGLCCNFVLDPISCRLFIPHKLFERWCEVSFQNYVLGLHNCYCPNPECSAFIINECGDDVKRSVCPKCKQAFCFKCKILWHEGLSCEESVVIRDPNEVAFCILAEKKKWKRCPRCKQYIERSEGCSSIKCRCGIQFCYDCGFSSCKCYIIYSSKFAHIN